MSLSKSEHLAWSSFFVAHGVMSKQINGAMEESGVVSLETYDVLLQLELADGRRLKMSELADRVLFSRSGVSRLADRLEKQGLIKREACCDDRRAVYAVLSQKGLMERERAWPILRGAIAKEFAANLDAGDAEKIAHIFLRLCAKLGRPLNEHGCSGD